MRLKLENKRIIIDKFYNLIKDSLSVVLMDFSGINSNKMNELRKLARKSSVDVFVVKNTLITFAIKNTHFCCLKDILNGPTLLVLSKKEFGIGARLLLNFFKDDLKFKIKGASFNGELLKADKINHLAAIPTYNESISRFIFVVLEISIVKFIRVISKIDKIKE